MSTINFWQAGRYFPHRWGTIPLQTGITLGRRRDELKKRILWGLAAAAGLLLIALIWILDIPHWQKLDLDKIYAQPASSVVYDTSGEPVGALAGMMPRTGAEAAGSFDDEMLVLVNFGSKLLNQFLQELRAAKIPGVALKAVLTPTNAEWNSVRLHEEIRREHEAMRYGGPAHPPAGK